MKYTEEEVKGLSISDFVQVLQETIANSAIAGVSNSTNSYWQLERYLITDLRRRLDEGANAQNDLKGAKGSARQNHQGCKGGTLAE